MKEISPYTNLEYIQTTADVERFFKQRRIRAEVEDTDCLPVKIKLFCKQGQLKYLKKYLNEYDNRAIILASTYYSKITIVLEKRKNVW